MSNIVSFKNPIVRGEQSYDGVRLTSKPRYDREWCLIHLATRYIEHKPTNTQKRLYEWIKIAWYDENRSYPDIFKILVFERFTVGFGNNLIFQEKQGAEPCFMQQGFLNLEKTDRWVINKHFECTEWQHSWWSTLSEFNDLGSRPILMMPDDTVRTRDCSSNIRIPLWMILDCFYPKL